MELEVKTKMGKSRNTKTAAKANGSNSDKEENPNTDEIEKLLCPSLIANPNNDDSGQAGGTRIRYKGITASDSRSRSEKVMARGLVGKYALFEVLNSDGKHPGFVGLCVKMLREKPRLADKARVVFVTKALLGGKAILQKNSTFPQVRMVVDTEQDSLPVAGKKLARFLTALSQKTKFPKTFSFGGVVAEGNLCVPWVDMMEFDEATSLVVKLFSTMERQDIATNKTLIKMVYGNTEKQYEQGMAAILEHGNPVDSDSDQEVIELSDSEDEAAPKDVKKHILADTDEEKDEDDEAQL